jgi:hypothetical protein
MYIMHSVLKCVVFSYSVRSRIMLHCFLILVSHTSFSVMFSITSTVSDYSAFQLLFSIFKSCIRSYMCIWYSCSWEYLHSNSQTALTPCSCIRIHKRNTCVWKLKWHLGRWVKLPASSQISCTTFFICVENFSGVFENITVFCVAPQFHEDPPLHISPLYPILLQTCNEIYCAWEGYVYAACSSEENLPSNFGEI